MWFAWLQMWRPTVYTESSRNTTMDSWDRASEFAWPRGHWFRESAD